MLRYERNQENENDKSKEDSITAKVSLVKNSYSFEITFDHEMYFPDEIESHFRMTVNSDGIKYFPRKRMLTGEESEESSEENQGIKFNWSIVEVKKETIKF